jgi:long-chain fatty acid transport protein
MAIAALSVIPGWAKGIFIQPGARDSAMGSAMTAVADDVTAVYYNPAGLAQKNGSGIEASCFYESNDATSNKSLNNSASPVIINGDFPIQQVLPTEPSQFNSKNFETNASVPFIGAYKNINNITYALSVYGIGGGGGKWNDSLSDLTGKDNITESIDGSYAFIIYNFSAAKNLTPKLSLGLGIDVVNMLDNTNVQKGYTRGTGSIMPFDYDLAINQCGTGYGIQLDGGMIYKFNDKLKGGLVLRSGTTIKLSGQAKYINTIYGVNSTTDYNEDYTYPLTYGIGVSYEPKTFLTLALSIDENQYSSMHETLKYNTQVPGVFDNIATPLDGRNWNDTTQVHIGMEYRCGEKLALRAGIQNDPTPFSTNQLTLTELNQYNFMYYTIGAGYKIGQVNLDICYAYCPTDKPSIGDRNYDYPLNVYRLGARYSF